MNEQRIISYVEQIMESLKQDLLTALKELSKRENDLQQQIHPRIEFNHEARRVTVQWGNQGPFSPSRDQEKVYWLMLEVVKRAGWMEPEIHWVWGFVFCEWEASSKPSKYRKVFPTLVNSANNMLKTIRTPLKKTFDGWNGYFLGGRPHTKRITGNYQIFLRPEHFTSPVLEAREHIREAINYQNALHRYRDMLDKLREAFQANPYHSDAFRILYRWWTELSEVEKEGYLDEVCQLAKCYYKRVCEQAQRYQQAVDNICKSFDSSKVAEMLENEISRQQRWLCTGYENLQQRIQCCGTAGQQSREEMDGYIAEALVEIAIRWLYWEKLCEWMKGLVSPPQELKQEFINLVQQVQQVQQFDDIVEKAACSSIEKFTLTKLSDLWDPDKLSEIFPDLCHPLPQLLRHPWIKKVLEEMEIQSTNLYHIAAAVFGACQNINTNTWNCLPNGEIRTEWKDALNQQGPLLKG